MSTERDQGFEALQRGDVAAANGLLETACQQDPNDYQAHMYLGAAYGQAGRHADAIQVLTRAVQIEPGNAQARYNLGISLERGGWTQEATTAVQQALTLQPDYPKAQEALQRLMGTTQAAPATPGFGAPAPTSAAPADQTVQGGAQPAGLANYGAPPQQPAYGQPTPPAYGQPGLGSPTYTPPQPAYNPAAFRPVAQAPYFEDSFNLGQGFKDWIQVLISPNQFFADQAGRDGKKAPMATFVAYMLVAIVLGVLMSLVKPNPSAPVGPGFTLLISILGAVINFFVLLVYALILHGVGKMFGNSATYSGSFRATVYSVAPIHTLGILTTIIMPFMVASTPPVTPGMGGNGFGFAPPAQTRILTAQENASTPHRLILAQDPGFGGGGMGRMRGQRGMGGPGGMPTTPPGFGGPDSGPMGGGPMGGPYSSQRSGQNPFANPAFGQLAAMGAFGIIIGLIELLWVTILLVIGVSSIQRISAGAAFGTVVLTDIAMLVLFVGVIIVLGILFAGIFMAAGSAGGMGR